MPSSTGCSYAVHPNPTLFQEGLLPGGIQLKMLKLHYFLLCSSIVGICCKDGLVFGVEKLVLSKLYEHGTNKRIFHIDNHIGMVRIHFMFATLYCKISHQCYGPNVTMPSFLFRQWLVLLLMQDRLVRAHYKNHNLSLPFGQPALEFYLPEAILN